MKECLNDYFAQAVEQDIAEEKEEEEQEDVPSKSTSLKS